VRIETSKKDFMKNGDAGECRHEPTAKSEWHVLESILSRPPARRLLKWMTATDGGAECFFERLCRSYNNPALSARERWKWRAPEFLIDLDLRKAGLEKERMTEKLFHHQPTVRALALAGRSIAKYSLHAPQCFAAPLMVVWNPTNAGLQSPLPALLSVRNTPACAG